MPDVAEVAAELYAIAPGDFTAARNARAKAARADGDRDLAARVTALRRPTVAAWAVNTLVRRRPDAVEDLLALGEQLRAAQAAMAGPRLRELVRRQHDLMADLRRQAEALAADAGLSLTDAVAGQVEGTLRAAMTDPDAEAAVRSGMLTGELLSTGFGPVEIGDAVAVPDAPPVLEPGRRAATPAGPVPAPPDTDTAGGPHSGTGTGPAPRRGTAAPSRRSRVTVVEEPPPRAAAAGSGRRTVAPDDAATDRAEPERRGAHEAARAAKDAREAAARRAHRAAAEQDADLAEQAAQDAAEVLAAADDAVADLARRHAELSAQIEELTARLHELEALRTTTGRDERRAHAARQTAARNAEAALRRARAARRRLDDVEPG